MGDVQLFPGITSLPTDPDRILESAMGKLETVVMVGITEDGEFYFASSDPDAAQATWHLQRGIYRLNQMVDDMERGEA
jgi:hypothetical protein